MAEHNVIICETCKQYIKVDKVAHPDYASMIITELHKHIGHDIKFVGTNTVSEFDYLDYEMIDGEVGYNFSQNYRDILNE